VAVQRNGVPQAEYTDGTLVKKVVGGETTIYVGSHVEKNVSTGEVTKSYALGDRRVAMRRGSTLTYLHGDHLGSASLATTAGGGVQDEMRLRGLYAPIRMETPVAARWRRIGASLGSGKRRRLGCTTTPIP
jgi:hypothetical protein